MSWGAGRRVRANVNCARCKKVFAGDLVCILVADAFGVWATNFSARAMSRFCQRTIPARCELSAVDSPRPTGPVVPVSHYISTRVWGAICWCDVNNVLDGVHDEPFVLMC